MASAIGLTLACRDTSPQPEHNYNLGDASRPLMPSPLPSYDRGILEGKSGQRTADASKRPGTRGGQADKAAVGAPPGGTPPGEMPATETQPTEERTTRDKPDDADERPAKQEPKRKDRRDTGTPLDAPTLDEMLRHQY